MEEPSDLDWSAASDEELLSLAPPPVLDQYGERTPEALIRKETKAICFFRVLVAMLLGLAAIALSLFVFLFMKSIEQSAFTSDFESSALRLVDTFVDAISHRLGTTKTLAAAIHSTMEAQSANPTNFSFAPGRMRDLTQNSLTVEKATIVTWSPLLRTDQERRDFELYVSTQEVRQEEPCFLCGSSSLRVANPNEVVSVVGHGMFLCSALETAALSGALRKSFCPVLAKDVIPVCGCVDVDPTQKHGTELTELAYPTSIFGMGQGANTTISIPYGQPPYSPIWEVNALACKRTPFLYDMFHSPVARKAQELVMAGNIPVMTETFLRSGPYYERFDLLMLNQSSVMIIGPVYDAGKTIVGFTMTERPWKRMFIKPEEAFSDTPMVAVIQNTCGQELTFTPNFRLGDLKSHDHWRDVSDPKYEHLAVASSYEDFEKAVNFGSPWPTNRSSLDYCAYRIVVYPTVQHCRSFMTSRPIVFASVTFFSFIFSAVVFALYDWLVRRRQQKVMEVAVRTDRIVSSLYPENVRNRLFRQVTEVGASVATGKSKIENLFHKGLENSCPSSEPIADIFPSATVMFFDIANFTVWSSERHPSAIFTLLECIYGSLDIIAARLGVFKVETIGDAYVAVCGLPHANREHAVTMARFGALCLAKFAKLVQSLEVRLGPSTGDLQARVGLHSGPVVAGVLRGTKARFQLFGDTVNLAARLESTGCPMHIHATKATCDLLKLAGKGHWIRMRDDIAIMKGKASSQTYWVNPSLPDMSDEVSSRSVAGLDVVKDDKTITGIAVVEHSARKKILRLVEWNVEVLFERLQAMVAVRQSHTFENGIEPTADIDGCPPMVVDEIVSVLDLPQYDKGKIERRTAAKGFPLPKTVREQLHNFVLEVAMSYHNVPFHNFDHASHVVMSARTLMNRVIEPGEISADGTGEQIHQSTYGISSDPLMSFTVVFSSLIHDCGHTGLTNEELSHLDSPLAQLYRNKSIAEQNSVDKAWAILLEPRFADLRACIYTNQAELVRFRQLLVNAVISTDLADARLKTLREERWEAAFLAETAPPSDESFDANRRATVIYEYIIQAADVAHTMQHWNTYQKFNRRLFEERYVAWVNGCARADPAVGWYEGELGFFDFYIIPLARKLNRCGVFGASYDALVTYALENRKEWEQKGRGIVSNLHKHCQAKYGTIDDPNEDATASLSAILST